MYLIQKNKPQLPTQLLHLFQIYMPFLLPWLQVFWIKKVRKEKLQKKEDKDSLNRHLKTAEVTADTLSDKEERENAQVKRRDLKLKSWSQFE